MKLNIYVNFNGKCREAFDFYVKYLGGKIISVTTFGQMPGMTEFSERRKNEIAHARIEIGESVIMGADIPNAEPMRSAYLTLLFNSSDEAQTIYEFLITGGEVFQKMEKTAFATRFAMFRDQFGISWMILCQD